MNLQEKAVKAQLASLRSQKKWIGLSLRPAIGSTIITEENNRLFINEGRDGEFENISESFYDSMVLKYDSRVTKKGYGSSSYGIG